MEPTLLILAAGIGSRYGGMKQLDIVGPSGETIMDYSIFDAQRAGIKKIVFIIKGDAEREFNETIIKKYIGKANIDYVVQDLSMIPDGFNMNAARIKPWGTGHAVLVAAAKIKGPFIVINADDFYGFASFKILTDYLVNLPADNQTEYGLTGFILKNTLSDNGAVSRAICETDSQHYLKTITERVSIRRVNGHVVYSENNQLIGIDENAIISLNMWGFSESIFPKLRELFNVFLERNQQSTDKEFLLPDCIDELIRTKFARVKVLQSDAEWFGLTYKEDKPSVVSRINKLIASGAYPDNLLR